MNFDETAFVPDPLLMTTDGSTFVTMLARQYDSADYIITLKVVAKIKLTGKEIYNEFATLYSENKCPIPTLDSASTFLRDGSSTTNYSTGSVTDF